MEGFKIENFVGVEIQKVLHQVQVQWREGKSLLHKKTQSLWVFLPISQYAITTLKQMQIQQTALF